MTKVTVRSEIKTTEPFEKWQVNDWFELNNSTDNDFSLGILTEYEGNYFINWVMGSQSASYKSIEILYENLKDLVSLIPEIEITKII